jgi:hypothetical protein
VQVTVGPDGTFDTPYEVKRDLPTWDNFPTNPTPVFYDCAAAATPCRINTGGGGLGDAPITFSASSNPTEPPAVVTQPAFTG